MLDICLLGTGGMMPLPRRWLTSLMTRYNGSNLMIDCGEGTQVAVKEKGWSFKPIDTICFTHYHADHISGLPGMLLSAGDPPEVLESSSKGRDSNLGGEHIYSGYGSGVPQKRDKAYVYDRYASHCFYQRECQGV